MRAAGEALCLQFAPELRCFVAPLLPALLKIFAMNFNGRVSKASPAFRKAIGPEPTANGLSAEATLATDFSSGQALANHFHDRFIAIQTPLAIVTLHLLRM
jgi:hypothetical protein